MNFELISDSSCDLKPSIVEEFGINIVPFYFSFDGETYFKEGHEYTSKDFFNKLSNEDIYPKTSLPSVQDYCDIFEPILKEGKDIICLCISSKFSGSYQSAANAKMNLADSYPDRRIEVIDSQAATGAQGEIVKFVARLRKNNATISDVLTALEDSKLTYKVFFTVDSLEYLAKGGRLGKAGLLLGTLLDVKPILNHSNGELFPVAKVRKKKKAYDHIINEAFEYSKLFDKFTLNFIYCLDNEDSQLAYKMTQKKFGKDVEINMCQLGSTIGVHTGPTAVGIVISNYEK